MAWVPSEARAQDEGSQVSFITPFPDGDTYRVQLVGDWWAEGMIEGLVESFAGDTRVQINRKNRTLNSVFRPDFEEDMRSLEEQMSRERSHIVILMMGIADRVSIRLPNGRRAAVASDEWRAEYTKRIDRIIRAVRRPSTAVYWVSQPKLRREEADEAAQMMNELVRERVYLNGMKYIDVYTGFSDESGNFNAYGPDLTGKMRLLRDPEGVGFTGLGYRKLAYFVEREVTRDLTQARAERNIPLAGSEAEQARINPQKAAEAARPAGPAGGKPAVPTAAGPPISRPDQGLEQKADNGRISLKMAGVDGREELVTMDILRPAIPASVIALVTRRQVLEKPVQPGDVVPEDIPGGLTILSTITPTNESAGGRRRTSPTQTAYFKVLVKGERLLPKPGRTDDFTWPRPDATLPVQPAAAVAEPAPQAAAPPARPGPAGRRRTSSEPRE